MAETRSLRVKIAKHLYGMEFGQDRADDWEEEDDYEQSFFLAEADKIIAIAQAHTNDTLQEP